MKKVLIILVLSFLPIIASAQTTVATENEVITETTVKENNTTTSSNTKATTLKAETRATLMNLNYKKSNDLISIKAFRKSLQIKQKTIKMC